MHKCSVRHRVNQILVKCPNRGEIMSATQALHSFFFFFFYKNVVFYSEAEYSYFSVEFRLKIFLNYSYGILTLDLSVLGFQLPISLQHRLGKE